MSGSWLTTRVIAVAGAFCGVAAGAHAQPCATFETLGYLDPHPPNELPYSEPMAISADGSVVAGRGADATGWLSLFRWTSRTGMQNIGRLVERDYEPRAISDDGSVIVGAVNCVDDPFKCHSNLFRWSAAEGVRIASEIPGAPVEDSVLYDCTPDGSVMVGVGYYSFLWNVETGFENLGPSGLPWIVPPLALSADGLVVLINPSGDSGTQATLWTRAAGYMSLGHLPGGTDSRGTAMTPDARVVTGTASSPRGPECFRWTVRGGMRDLGPFPRPPEVPPDAQFLAEPSAISADGSVITGMYYWSYPNAPERLFIWDRRHGARDLRGVLAQCGVDLSSWALYSTVAMSADGRRIVGHARMFGVRGIQAWRVTLPAYCEADYTDDGRASIDDLFAFLQRFAAGDRTTDLDDDGSVGVGDFLAFLSRYAEGCGR
jgi:uncharacterized membrane protein